MHVLLKGLVVAAVAISAAVAIFTVEFESRPAAKGAPCALVLRDRRRRPVPA